MNARNLIAAIAVFTAGSACADVTGNFEDFTHVPSNKTRAEVIAEMNQARAQAPYANAEWTEPTPLASTRTRAEVVAELKAAQVRGEMVHTDWVDWSAHVNTGTRTRAEVRAEAIQNARNAKRDARQDIGG